MTISRLRQEMTQAELVYFAAYFELKGEREAEAMDRARNKRR